MSVDPYDFDVFIERRQTDQEKDGRLVNHKKINLIQFDSAGSVITYFWMNERGDPVVRQATTRMALESYIERKVNAFSDLRNGGSGLLDTSDSQRNLPVERLTRVTQPSPTDAPLPHIFNGDNLEILVPGFRPGERFLFKHANIVNVERTQQNLLIQHLGQTTKLVNGQSRTETVLFNHTIDIQPADYEFGKVDAIRKVDQGGAGVLDLTGDNPGRLADLARRFYGSKPEP